MTIIQRIFLTGTFVYLYGENLLYFGKMNGLFPKTSKLSVRFLSFLFYISGLIAFVLNLKEGHYKFQFSQLALTIMSLLFVIVQSHFIVKNMKEGLIWFVAPSLLVITNDVFAYFAGKLFGKTKLIKISPKKTLEGFIGGLIFTMLISLYVFIPLIKY